MRTGYPLNCHYLFAIAADIDPHFSGLLGKRIKVIKHCECRSRIYSYWVDISCALLRRIMISTDRSQMLPTACRRTRAVTNTLVSMGDLRWGRV
jgi:hypothetical protein